MAALRARQARRADRGRGALSRRARTRDARCRAHPDRQAVVARRRGARAAGGARHPRGASATRRSTGSSSRLRAAGAPRATASREVIDCAAAALAQAPGGRARRAREMARLPRRAAPRALRRGDRPAGPDQVGAGRAPARAGRSYGLANRTEGSSHEAPARWLVDHGDPRSSRTSMRSTARASSSRARSARGRSGAAALRPAPHGARRRDRAARVVLRARHLARRQAVARGALDRARPPPVAAGWHDRAAAGERATSRRAPSASPRRIGPRRARSGRALDARRASSIALGAPRRRRSASTAA